MWCVSQLFHEIGYIVLCCFAWGWQSEIAKIHLKAKNIFKQYWYVFTVVVNCLVLITLLIVTKTFTFITVPVGMSQIKYFILLKNQTLIIINQLTVISIQTNFFIVFKEYERWWVSFKTSKTLTSRVSHHYKCNWNKL